MSRFVSFIHISFAGFAVCAWLAFGLPAAQAQGLAEHIDGFPVMSGLQENANAFVMFDKAEGRIIEGQLMGQVAADAAKAYYSESLAQLGWQISEPTLNTSEQVFLRERERLVLRYEGAAGELTISVSLQPAPSRQ